MKPAEEEGRIFPPIPAGAAVLMARTIVAVHLRGGTEADAFDALEELKAPHAFAFTVGMRAALCVTAEDRHRLRVVVANEARAYLEKHGAYLEKHGTPH